MTAHTEKLWVQNVVASATLVSALAFIVMPRLRTMSYSLSGRLGLILEISTFGVGVLAIGAALLQLVAPRHPMTVRMRRRLFPRGR